MRYISFSILLLVFSCFIWSFTINGTFPPFGITELITHEEWTRSEAWSDDDGDGDGVFVLDMDSCKADNHWLFDTTGHLLISEGINICEPDYPQMDSVDVDWQLDNTQNYLNISFDSIMVLHFQVYSIGLQVLELHLLDEDHPLDPPRSKLILRR